MYFKIIKRIIFVLFLSLHTSQKRLVTIDCTNGMEAEQSFLLNIITGAGIGSGTTARVFCEIKGMLIYI